MAIGLVVGDRRRARARGLLRWSPLPDRSLYPIAVVLAAGVIYGAAAVAHGSGFLAVFVAGIVVGDLEYDARRAVRHFDSALADLGELAVFVALGLTIDLAFIADEGLWWRGLVLAVAPRLRRPAARRRPAAPAAMRLTGATRLHRLERPQGRGPDPARVARRRRRGRRRRGDLRDRVRRRPLLGRRPGHARADRGGAARRADGRPLTAVTAASPTR